MNEKNVTVPHGEDIMKSNQHARTNVSTKNEKV